MKKYSKRHNRMTLFIEITLTVVLCFGMAWISMIGLRAEADNYATEVMADYNALTRDYMRDFKILRMEAIEQINKDLTFDEMQTWLQSRDDDFMEAIGDDIYDGFAYTYKGGYVHSWNYGDYTNYDPATRPWYQIAQAADGEVAVVAPYVTFLSNTDLIDAYDILRMSISQRYNDEISFDFDLDVSEINALIAERRTIYSGTLAFLYDKDGYILSSTDAGFYGHNINTADAQVSKQLCNTLRAEENSKNGISIHRVDGKLMLLYSLTDAENKTICLLISFSQVFQRNFLFVLLLACVLLAIEILFYHRNEVHLKELEKNKQMLKEALEQAEQASHAKGNFMSKMSHEIRTPLNAVIGYLDIARDEKEDREKVAHCLEQSVVASRHLLSIINDVLDISSIESGRMKIANEDFDLSRLLNSLTTIFYAQAKKKGVLFEVLVTDLTQEWVCGDSLRLNQILMNLLSNAIKFTPKDGKVMLNVQQSDMSDGKVHMKFTVTDTGIGMSKEYMERIFTPFEQESASTAQKYGGTGLGLSISNNLVQMMGGTMEVESEQEKGTTFTVTLTLGQSETGKSEHLTTESFSNLRALVVDDDENSCEYIQKLLARCGVKCDTITSGKKAVRRVKSRIETGNGYDFCIIDWYMEGMDGMETAREIRKLCGAEVPIIIATAYDYSSIIDEAKKAGVNRIISKPLFQSTLFNMLVNTYGKYEPKQENEKRKVDFRGMHVLLAEDNEMNMEIALDILSKAGLKVTPAGNGKEALDAFVSSDKGTFDAILMDIQMPVMDGYEATRQIRKSNHPQAKSIPIIAMTANAFTSDVTAALAAGMNDHIAKPVSYKHLFDALTRLTAENEEKQE